MVTFKGKSFSDSICRPNQSRQASCLCIPPKRINFLSTEHKNETVEKRVRSKNDPSVYRTVKKPVAADNYKQNMAV